jgi:cysteine desulfurase family protein (TIGR01976 family)
MNFNVDYVREQFPALCKTVNGFPAVFLDGPGGTQVPRRVVEKINDYLYYRNANAHGAFKTSVESDALLWHARETFADFFNCLPEEVAFGENTSSINFKLAFGFARSLKPGDEVLVTDIDHEGNRSPWRTLADFGIVVKSVKIDPDTITLDYEDFKSKLSDKTKLLAINWAANSCGTVSDIKKFIDDAHKAGAITVVDAVHYAPHKLIDVKALGTDILLCSSYKFFGPHLGIVYFEKQLGEKFKSTRVLADDNTEMPYKLETGTPAFEIIAGAAEAVEFIADIGRMHPEMFAGIPEGISERRKNIVAGMAAIDEYEDGLATRLRSKLALFPKVKIYGPGEDHPKTSTVSFTVEGVNSNDVGKFFAERGLFVWDGDFYAVETICNVLKLEERGGFVRIGFAPYTLVSEVDRVVDALEELLL